MPSDEPQRLMMIGEVCRRLGCSAEWVRRLDGVLRPERSAARRVRLYRPEVVEAYALQRAEQALRPPTTGE